MSNTRPIVKRDKNGKVIYFTINRKSWGDALTLKRRNSKTQFHLESSLHILHTNLKCCLGHYLSACGVEKKYLVDIAYPNSVNSWSIPEEVKWLFEKDDNFESHEYNLAAINDNETLPSDIREAMIKNYFSEHGITVEFVG